MTSSIGFIPSADELIAVNALLSLFAACEESHPVPVKNRVKTIQSEIVALSALFLCLGTTSSKSDVDDAI